MHPNDFAMQRAADAEAKQDAAFASDLGLKPGEWPRMISYEGRPLFRGAPTRDAGGDLESYQYRASGFILTVWND